MSGMWAEIVAAVASVLGLTTLAAGARLIAAWQRARRDKNIARLEREMGMAALGAFEQAINNGTWTRRGPRAAAARWSESTSRAAQNYSEGVASLR